MDDYQTLILQQIADKAGWERGKRESLDWALHALRMADHREAAEFLEGLVYGETVLRIQQTKGFKPGQHQESNKAEKAKAPNTTPEWPNQKPS